MTISDYEQIKFLGEGTFGKTYLYNDKQTKQTVVIKHINTINIQNKQALQREIELMKGLDHPNIVRYLRSFYT